MFIALGICVYRVVSWTPVSNALLSAEKTDVFLNPFSTGGRLGLKYFIMIMITRVLGTGAWATGMQKVMSASSPKDARLIMLLKNLRLASFAGIQYCGLAVMAVMLLPHFAHIGLAEAVSKLDPSIQNQMAGPILLARLLPVGIMGLMFAGMMSAFISTNDSYILTWSGIIVQDVIYPLRKKPLSRKQHIWLLRITVVCVGIFLYFFGIFYKPTEAIVVFQVLNGAIYTSGAGTMIIFGLYWRRGNKYGAYGALIVGALIPILNHIFKWIGGLEGGITAYITALTVYIGLRKTRVSIWKKYSTGRRRNVRNKSLIGWLSRQNHLTSFTIFICRCLS